MDTANHKFGEVEPQYVDASATTAILLGICVLVGEQHIHWDYLENQLNYNLIFNRRWWLLN